MSIQIDFHTHTFPESIAAAALEKLSLEERLPLYTKGTNQSLLASMKEADIQLSVLLPVATRPGQTAVINEEAIEVLEAFRQNENALLSFGALHPDNENYKEILRGLKAAGIPGIKLHPVFQKTHIDDIRYLRIIEAAISDGFIINIHAGRDMALWDATYADPAHVHSMMKRLAPDKMILSHMGSWANWQEADALLEDLLAQNIHPYVDTAFVLSPDAGPYFGNTTIPAMGEDRFCRLVRRLGADHVLFGTDSPWTGQKESIAAIQKLPLSAEEKELILGKAAMQLLNLQKRS